MSYQCLQLLAVPACLYPFPLVILVMLSSISATCLLTVVSQLLLQPTCASISPMIVLSASSSLAPPAGVKNDSNVKCFPFLRIWACFFLCKLCTWQANLLFLLARIFRSVIILLSYIIDFRACWVAMPSMSKISFISTEAPGLDLGSKNSGSKHSGACAFLFCSIQNQHAVPYFFGK